MTVKHTSGKQELADLMSAGGPVIVAFSALSWCMPCRRLAPHFEAAAKAVPEVTWVDVSLDDPANDDVVKFFNILSVPTILVFPAKAPSSETKYRTAPQLITLARSLLL